MILENWTGPVRSRLVVIGTEAGSSYGVKCSGREGSEKCSGREGSEWSLVPGCSCYGARPVS